MALLPILFLIVILTLLALHLHQNRRALPQSIPGPLLASLTDLWRAYHQRRGLLRGELLALHARHGPLVRYGVRSVSVADPRAIDEIYGGRGFVTANSYKVLVGISNGREVPSLVSTADESRHAALRRSVVTAFTPAGSLDYEGFVDETVPELLDALQREGRESGKFDLARWLMLYSMDSAARMAFSEGLGCLRTGQDVGGSIELVRDRLRHWGWWSSLPGLESWVYRNRWAMSWGGRTPGAMAAEAARKLKLRLSLAGEEKERMQTEKKDMLQKFIEAHEANPQVIDHQGVVGLLMSTISGAGDTTATTMAAVVYYLLRNPGEMAKLRKELEEAGWEAGLVQSYAVAGKLHFLHAVIRESMRMFPTVTWPIERLVPEGGVEVAGILMPEGTSLGVHVNALHRDRSVFGEDVETFRPGRWLDGDVEKVRMMEKVHMSFSRGRRVCLGQHVAVMQMKKVIPSLVMRFDMSIVDLEKELEADMSPAVACLKPLWIKIDGERC